MIYHIQGGTVNDVALYAYDSILKHGKVQESRNGNVHFLNNVAMTLKDPRARHLYLKGRKSNIAAQIAETFWVLAGDDRINPFLSFFLPRAKDYSDDGVTWRGAYGPRLYMYGQLQDAVNAFLEEGINTRRSVIQILLPELDSKHALVNQTGCQDGTTKDRPCNNELVFFCTKDEETGKYRLNLNCYQRSGDAIWGALNINVFEWTMLQELVAHILNSHMDEEVVLGEFTHFVANLHIYDFTAEQAKAAVSEADNWSLVRGNFLVKGMTGLDTVAGNREFFSDLVGILTDAINDDLSTFSLYDKKVCEHFLTHDVDVTVDNLLIDYAMIVLMYIFSKKEGGIEVVQETYGELNFLNPDFRDCLVASPFIKFLGE